MALVSGSLLHSPLFVRYQYWSSNSLLPPDGAASDRGAGHSAQGSRAANAARRGLKITDRAPAPISAVRGRGNQNRVASGKRSRCRCGAMPSAPLPPQSPSPGSRLNLCLQLRLPSAVSSIGGSLIIAGPAMAVVPTAAGHAPHAPPAPPSCFRYGRFLQYHTLCRRWRLRIEDPLVAFAVAEPLVHLVLFGLVPPVPGGSRRSRSRYR